MQNAVDTVHALFGSVQALRGRGCLLRSPLHPLLNYDSVIREPSPTWTARCIIMP